MRALVLGSAAGGGFPQWNCGCQNCAGVRAGTLSATPRTQASLAVSGNGHSWILLSASPDLRTQLEASPALWPQSARHSPIVGVAIPNADVDSWGGLLTLREWTPLELFATEVVRADLMSNPVLRTLDRFEGHTRWNTLKPGARLPLPGDLTIEAVPVAGKTPLHSAAERAPDPLDNVGFIVRDTRSSTAIGWFPAVAGPSHELLRALAGVEVLFFDGTFYRDDELLVERIGPLRARQMGHWQVGGEEGSARFLRSLAVREKWLVHVNNTNPLLRDDSAERAILRASGIEVAYDQLERRLG